MDSGSCDGLELCSFCARVEARYCVRGRCATLVWELQERHYRNISRFLHVCTTYTPVATCVGTHKTAVMLWPRMLGKDLSYLTSFHL
jgi:hypothetical protein